MPATILLIEDDADYSELISYRLRSAGYTVITASDGQTGLERARREQPDLILTDLMLPKLNGYEICSLLKQDLRYQKIPILVFSATKMQDRDAHLAMECGANAYILKSLEPRLLVERVQALLSAPPSSH